MERSMDSECQLFRSKFDLLYADLESAAADTTRLAYQLYSRSIVGKGLRSEVEEAATPGRAASKLLGAVESRIESHPRDLDVFVKCLGTFPTWEHHAEDMAKKMKEMEAQMVRPLPVSDPSSFSPASSAPGAGHPVDIRLIIFPNGGSAVPVCGGEQPQEPFVLRSAPVDRKHPPQPTASSPAPSSKPFQQTSSPSTNSLSSLSSDHTTPSCSTSSASLSVITEEATDDPPPLGDSMPLRTNSQTSTASTFEEDVILMKGSLEELMEKYCSLRRKIDSRDKQVKTMQAELARSKETFAAAIETANQETKDLQKQVDMLQVENRELRDDLERTRESVMASNQQKQALLHHLQMSFEELKQCKELCSRLEEQMKASTQDGELMEKYQRSKERERELEEQLEACKKTVIEYGDKIQLLEMEVNVLLGSGSLSLSSSFSDGDGWAVNPEQEDSGGLESLLGSV
jgi:predicted  nucleic acid-binding Zn-ribbon protein